ncbi:transglutaminase family protein [Chelativorans sp. ZYF759]|uniref:transglutaminase family protein n=1 Tax=Chelativorans sp. ZYF759 TaxID=2692213 RepID=UPI00145ED79A|nr:transglutaminase family protein [Chelativorans sp. ZYF759]NMG40073.1 transglutaminase family protein [Chelativorans sp. ZYF759]
MLLKIRHVTTYRYQEPVRYGLQRLRIVPVSGPTQRVLSWKLEIEGAREEVRFSDQFANDTRLLSVDGDQSFIEIVADGEVETLDSTGIYGREYGFAPLWLFGRETDLTRPGEGVATLMVDLPGTSEVDRLHALIHRIREQVEYVPGTTDVGTTAEEALAQGQGVCQDHAHIFIAVARRMGLPARYISGYLMMDGVDDQVATHAWAEVHVETLGWVGFDVSNGISPDERYVRLAVGLDYRCAMPVSGIRTGQGTEELAVHISVQQ